MQDAEQIKPYDNNRPKTEQVRQMFDSIAPAYDFMNRAMTLGIDKWWRKCAVNRLKKVNHNSILDVATGTGDLAILLCRQLHPASLIGIDLSEKMLNVAKEKASDAAVDNIASFQVADCLNLPFDDNTFDCVTVAYGVRNFEHLDKGYTQMCRVLKNGGTLCVIELSTPTSPLIRPLYNLYTRHIIPLLGRRISRDPRAYSYLPESIAAVAQGDEMTAKIIKSGFSSASFKRLTFGVCTIYLATK